MNVIPKLQQGGSFDSLFVEYKPIQAPEVSPRSQAAPRTSRGNDDKGKLTEKDLFTMIKEVDGLPNEMKSLVDNLIDTFQTSRLMGADVNDLATTYLSSLYQMRVLQQNKVKYDAARKNASDNGALQEPAITASGKFMAQTQDGKIHEIGLETYFDNKDQYQLLTVANIARLRAFDTKFNYDQDSFDIMDNSIGFESFQKLVDTAKTSLGSSTVTRDGSFSVQQGRIQQGLQLLQALQENDRVQALGSVTSDGLYEYDIIDKNQKLQIDTLTSYITTLLPERAKVWAAYKLRTPDKENATKTLVLNYLLSGQSIEHTFKVNTPSKRQTSSSGNGEDPKEGFWRQVQSGKGGTDQPYHIILSTTEASLNSGKYYGAMPGPKTNCSLGDFLTESGLGHLRVSNNGITFGNIELASNSLDDVMVNTREGSYAVTLPTKNGKVWLEAIEVYNNFKKELNRSGYQEGTEAYRSKVNELLRSPEYSALAPIIQSNGELTPQNSAHFLVLRGIASSKARGTDGVNQKSINDFDSQYIRESDDNELRRILEEGLSSEARGKYKTDDNLVWWNNDDIYEGNIFIPLNTNPIAGMNADNNEIKESTARRYEDMQQDWNKENNHGSTRSDALWQR